MERGMGKNILELNGKLNDEEEYLVAVLLSWARKTKLPRLGAKPTYLESREELILALESFIIERLGNHFPQWTRRERSLMKKLKELP